MRNLNMPRLSNQEKKRLPLFYIAYKYFELNQQHFDILYYAK